MINTNQPPGGWRIAGGLLLTSVSILSRSLREVRADDFAIALPKRPSK